MSEGQSGRIFPAGDLSLQEHLELLGVNAGHLSFLSKVPEPVIARALAGGHIARPHAEALCRALSKEHGAGVNQVGLQPEHMRGLQIWQLDEKHQQHQPKQDAHR